MKRINSTTGLEVVVSPGLINNMAMLGQFHYPSEFGGLLIGRYINENRTALIEKIITPVRYQSSRNSFERETTGLHGQLENYYNQEPKLSYVGEWHTHPDNYAVPSSLDLKAIHEIVQHKRVFIENPVLMIFNITPSTHSYRIYFFHQNKLIEYDQEEGS